MHTSALSLLSFSGPPLSKWILPYKICHPVVATCTSLYPRVWSLLLMHPTSLHQRKTQRLRCAQGDWRVVFFPIPPLVKLTLHQMVGFQTAFESSKISALKVTRSLLLISPKPLHGLDSLSRFPQFSSFIFFQRFGDSWVDFSYNKWRYFFNQFTMYDPVICVPQTVFWLSMSPFLLS